MAELWWLAGDGPRGLAEARAAVALLEAEPGGRDELAWALASLAQRLAVAAHPSEVVLEIGGRALALAEELGIEGAAVHALTTLGIIDAYGGAGSGSPDSRRLQESVERGRATGQTAAVTRSLINLAEAALHFRRLDEAERWTAEAMAWLEAESPGDLVFLRMLRLRQAEIDFERGHWDRVARVAEEILGLEDEQGSSNQVRVRAVTILGRIGARRGHLDPWPLLDEGMSLVGPDEIQDLGPLFAARIEACLLADEPDRATREARAALDMLARITPIADYLGGEAWYWSWRAGAVQVLPPEVPEPFRLETVGRPLDAARAWEEIGSPYQRALALLAAGDEASLQVALDILLGLGARPMARRAAARLRASGALTIRRGPWGRTRGNPFGLTDRQVEILALVGRGASNREIAASLVISPKTVDHHISAMLRKLGVANRRAAGRVAIELGMGLGGPAKDGESAARIAG
jgi:DNA-binding CsgD family transcriptional regulator